MNKPLIESLYGLPKFGLGIGLHRMQYLCQDLLKSTWAATVDPIHVVGSNGKGSTTVILAAILQQLKFKVGQYTSPHLFQFNERFVVNGQAIGDQDLENLLLDFKKREAIYSQNFPEDNFAAFEALTSMGLHYFCEEKVNALVLEAGIGGRYDSTRILPGTHLALTSIDLEHSQLLGATKELIAFDKVDMAPEGAKVFVGNLEPDLLRRLKAYGALRNLKFFPISTHCKIQNLRFLGAKMCLDMDVDGLFFDKLETNLLGQHQAENIALALLLLKSWLAKEAPAISEAELVIATRRALSALTWTGRLQKIKNQPATYIDVGHSPDALQQLAKAYQTIIGKQKTILVLGVSNDKDIAALISPLLPLANKIICTQAYHRAEEAAHVAEKVLELAPHLEANLSIEPILEQALDKAIAWAIQEDASVLVAGGLFLAIEAYAYWQGMDAKELRFY